MPRMSVWSLRAALIYLALGFTFGGLMLWHKGLPLSPFVWRLLPAHIEFLLFGWVVQLVFGVGFWILPRFRTPPKRGNESLAWLAFWLLNLGVLLAGLAPALGLSSWLALAGRAAEAGAAVAFTLHAWPRVRPTVESQG